MNAQRKHLFFWLGISILPLFWSWFTLAKPYTRRERIPAFLWLVIFTTWLFHHRQAFIDYWHIWSFTYPVVIGWLGAGLFIWLLFRISLVPLSIFEHVLALYLFTLWQPSTWFTSRIDQPFHWHWLIPPLLAAIAHLSIEPLDRLVAKLKIKLA